MVRITYCKHCRAWNAVFHCPRCKETTRCSVISDAWSECDGQVDTDELPIIECGSCGLTVEVGDLRSDSPHEVVFSTE